MYVRPTLGLLPGGPSTAVQAGGAIAQGISNWLGNVFGANNRPAIDDIQAALELGRPISAASWAEAGLPLDGGDWYVQWKIAHGQMPADALSHPVGVASGLLSAGASNWLILGVIGIGALLLLRR